MTQRVSKIPTYWNSNIEGKTAAALNVEKQMCPSKDIYFVYVQHPHCSLKVKTHDEQYVASLSLLESNYAADTQQSYYSV